jgi:hypothetical protein
MATPSKPQQVPFCVTKPTEIVTKSVGSEIMKITNFARTVSVAAIMAFAIGSSSPIDAQEKTRTISRN